MGQDVIQPTAAAPTGTVDVTDRAGRLVGVISAAALPLPAGAATAALQGSLDTGPSTGATRIAPAGTSTYKFHVPAGGAVATVTFPVTAGKRWVLHSLVASIDLNVATALRAALRVWDGATGTTQIAGYSLAVPAAIGNVDRIMLADLAMMGSVGLAMTVDFAAAGAANQFEAIAASAYLV